LFTRQRLFRFYPLALPGESFKATLFFYGGFDNALSISGPLFALLAEECGGDCHEPLLLRRLLDLFLHGRSDLIVDNIFNLLLLVISATT